MCLSSVLANMSTRTICTRLATVTSIALVYRLLNALTVRTYAAPDEHWQAPELAHKIIFGVGYV